jgi:selenocysteine lyase/cysteine desulfurase
MPFIRPIDVELANQLRRESMERAAREAKTRLQQSYDAARRSQGHPEDARASMANDEARTLAQHGLLAEYSKPVCLAGGVTQSTHEAQGTKPSPRRKVKKSSSTAK